MNQLVVLPPWLSDPNSGLVFHYTSHTAALEGILHTGRIIFGDLRHTNDPYESCVWDLSPGMWGGTVQDSTNNLIAADRIIDTIHRRCRLFCTSQDNGDRASAPDIPYLSRGFLIPPLWAHYATNHKGICLAFDKFRLYKTVKDSAATDNIMVIAKDVSYDGPPNLRQPAFGIDITGIESDKIPNIVLDHIQRYKEILLFTKDRTWSYENEFRLAVICCDDKPFEIDITDSIVGIILGSQFPECYTPLISRAQERFQIGIAQVEWEIGMPIVYPGVEVS
jgi:hypothetical protein